MVQFLHNPPKFGTLAERQSHLAVNETSSEFLGSSPRRPTKFVRSSIVEHQIVGLVVASASLVAQPGL